MKKGFALSRASARDCIMGCVLCVLCALSFTASANMFTPRLLHPYPIFGGFIVGYGSTNWSGLVATDDASLDAAPQSADDTGGVVGLFVGVQPVSQFILELSYVHYPKTTVHFDPTQALFCFLYNTCTLTTNTSAVSLIGKFLLPVAHLPVAVYADAGAGMIIRNDFVVHVRTRVTPTFGGGAMWDITRRLFADLGFQLYLGYGKAELMPVNDFIPFIYSVQLRVGFRLPVAER